MSIPKKFLIPQLYLGHLGLTLATLLHGHVTLSLEGRDVTQLSLVNIFLHLAGYLYIHVQEKKHCTLLFLIVAPSILIPSKSFICPQMHFISVL